MNSGKGVVFCSIHFPENYLPKHSVFVIMYVKVESQFVA